MLTILVPVRNETSNLEDIINYFSNNLTNLNYEVIIINDFSDNELNNWNKSKRILNAFFKAYSG